MTANEMQTEKQRLRTAMLCARKAMPFVQRQQADAAIAQRVLASNAWQAAQTIFAYVSLPHEVGTRALLAAALTQGKQLALPICDTGNHTMTFYRLMALSELQTGAYRIPVPPVAEERRVAPDARTLMLVPMLAFDAQGGRLGAGGGYYDRFLAQCSVQTMGLCYAGGFVQTLPSHAYDCRLQCCVTEKGTEAFHG